MRRGRILLLCGVVVPVLYAAADAVAGMGWEGYSFRDQTISELGAIGAPSRLVFSILLIVTYVALAAFGVGVWRAAKGRRGLRMAGGLIVGVGILALTAGQLSAMRMRGTEQGAAGAAHLIEGAVAMVMIFTAMGFAAAAVRRRFAVYTIVTIVVAVGFAAWSGVMAGPQMEAGLPTPWAGVVERIFWYVYQLWFAVLALKLLRESAPLPTAGGYVSGDVTS